VCVIAARIGLQCNIIAFFLCVIAVIPGLFVYFLRFFFRFQRALMTLWKAQRVLFIFVLILQTDLNVMYSACLLIFFDLFMICL